MEDSEVILENELTYSHFPLLTSSGNHLSPMSFKSVYKKRLQICHKYITLNVHIFMNGDSKVTLYQMLSIDHHCEPDR